MKLENILLGVLARRPSTGYELMKFMDSDGRFLRSNTTMSQVYRSLKAMEKRGWVDHTVERRPGATDAKTYRVTEAGATILLDWLTGPYAPPTRFEDPEFGCRLFFAGFMTRAQVIRLLDVEIDVRQDELSRFRNLDRRVRIDPTMDFDAGLQELVLEWGHRAGAAAKDAHVARCVALRALLLDTPEGANLHEVAQAWVAAQTETAA